jgi:hypothetical protein
MYGEISFPLSKTSFEDHDIMKIPKILFNLLLVVLDSLSGLAVFYKATSLQEQMIILNQKFILKTLFFIIIKETERVY